MATGTRRGAEQRPGRPVPSPRGYALIAVIGVLATLATLASAFLGLASTERQTAVSHLAVVRARMAAESGIAYAIAELRTTRTEADDFGTSPLARRQAWSDIRDRWIFGDAVNAPLGPRPFGVPVPALRYARKPSFVAGSAGGHAVSGPGPVTSPRQGEFYTLRAIDCASQLNVNDRNADLGRILDNLGAITGTGAIGKAILAARPARGYTDKIELLARAFGGDVRRFARVSDFLTCHGWVDPSTVRWFRRASRWKSEPRAPLNVNTASVEVMAAVLTGLRAEYPVRDAESRVMRWKEVGPIPEGTARRLAEHIAAQRTRFGQGRWSFNDWMHFCIEVIDSAAFLTQPEKDLVKASFNPSSDIRKLNPDRILVEPNPETDPASWTGIDKSDLVTGGTEACFASMGYYEITAIGRVVESGRTVAEHEVQTTCRLFDVIRATTQRDFEQDREWHDARFGALVSDEGLPAVVSGPEYPYASMGGYRSYGLKLPGVASSAAGRAPRWVWGRKWDANLGAQAEWSWAAEWDGHLQLSGVVRVKAATWPPERSSLLVGFNQGHLRPDLSPTDDVPKVFLEPTGAWRDIRPARVLPSVSSRVALPGRAFADGSDLHPFGLIVDSHERNRVKALPANNLPVARGSIEFLFKPAMSLDRLPPGVEMTLAHWSNGGSFNFAEMRIFAARGRVGVEWRFAGDGLPVPTERRMLAAAAEWTAHTWHHVEVDWDEDWTRLFVDGVEAEGEPVATPAVVPVFDSFRLLPPWFLLGARKWIEWAAPQELPAEVMIGDLGRNLESVRERLIRRMETRVEAVGTFDNLCVHPYPQHAKSFIPRSRYHDGSYRAYTASGTGPNGGTVLVGVYKKRLTAIGEAASREPVVLGTVSCTHYHPYHEHVEGHGGGAGAFGHITPGLTVEGDGRYLYYHAYDGGAGIPIGVPVRDGRTVSFLAEFEVADRLPVVETPILCDFTVTYMKRPVFLTWVLPRE